MGNLFHGPTPFILLFVIILLFGAPKLPALARSIGQSMKILKKEVSSDDSRADDSTNDRADGAASVTRPAAPSAAPFETPESGSTQAPAASIPAAQAPAASIPAAQAAESVNVEAELAQARAEAAAAKAEVEALRLRAEAEKHNARGRE